AVGLAPLLSLLFGEVSLVAPLLNLVAVPLATLVVVPLVLVGTVVLVTLDIALPLQLAGHMLSLAWPVVERIADWPVAAMSMTLPPLPVIALAFAGSAWLLAPPGWPLRRLGFAMLAPLFVWSSPSPDRGEFDVVFLDVGHGTAIVLRTRRHVLLYDTGPGWRNGASAAQRIIVPFLQSQRWRPDVIVVSHGDLDHYGGMRDLLGQYANVRVLAGDALPFVACRQGTRWAWDGVSIALVHPVSASWRGNNASCVVEIQSQHGCVLLTGDIERAAELVLLERYRKRCDVVAAPHHGSATSSTIALVESLSPRVVVFSSAFANRWGLPRHEVMARWRGNGAQLFDTGADGAVTVRFRQQKSISVVTERCKRRRPWSRRCRNRL
ncbi:MAG: ComEC/Rec2 family competence protein, partial [Gammaproteobacteria bacterium]|nr:ComEC/Rec2 family competence protein [Gammaproteobacteria bacterium]